MAQTLGQEARRELVAAVSGRYRVASRADRAAILDEFAHLTGFHRKHAIRVLNSGGYAPPPPRRGRPTLYGEAVQHALTILWEASDRICGKRLKPVLPVLIESMERHGHINLDGEVRERLLQMSAATIDRLLAPRRRGGGKKKSRPKRGVRSQVPVRTFSDWDNPRPGYLEIDLVAHCGGSSSGRYVHTLSATDIASGWTECIALPARDQSLVVEGLRRLGAMLPFRLRGIDSDNGSEFINETLQAFCAERGLEFTRSRPHQRNDQAWVEQKNGAVVRRLIGYGRLEGMIATDTLSRLYASSRLFVNFFQPSFKLVSKERNGARVSKKYDTPATPAHRLGSSHDVDEDTKARLEAVFIQLDPLRLLEEIRAVQGHLALLMSGAPSSIMTERDADLEAFLSGLANLWRSTEVRPTHAPAERKRHYWRTRVDPFAAVWPTVLVWLNAEPDRTAKELFQKLQDQHPGVFPDGQLRTLQRRVKAWRRQAALRLVLAAPGSPSLAPPDRSHGNIFLSQSGSSEF